MEAAKALVHVSIKSNVNVRYVSNVQLDTHDAGYMGSFLLLKLLDHLRPHGRNDFSDIAGYFVLKVSAPLGLSSRPPANDTERDLCGIFTS